MRSGNLEVGTDLEFLMNFTTLLYKTDIELFGAQLATGVFVPIVDLEIDSSLSINDSVFNASDSATDLGDIALIPFALYWNNDDTNYQTGRELHLDVAFNQFLSERFAIGLQGFYLKQITGDSGSGALLGDFKGEVGGVGPALLWATNVGGQEVSFIVKWLHEFHAKNRLDGDQVFLSFAIDW